MRPRTSFSCMIAAMLYSSLVVAEAQSKAEVLFDQFSRGEFLKDTRIQVVPGVGQVPLIQMGPDVEVDNGKSVHCSVLEFQGLMVAREGASAFETAFKHLDDNRVYMRWIAVVALERITGRKPLWYWFGDPNKPFNGDSTWSQRAKSEWKKWKQNKS